MVESQLADFSFDISEDDNEILRNLSSNGNLKDFLVPASFTNHSLIQIHTFAYK